MSSTRTSVTHPLMNVKLIAMIASYVERVKDVCSLMLLRKDCLDAVHNYCRSFWERAVTHGRLQVSAHYNQSVLIEKAIAIEFKTTYVLLRGTLKSFTTASRLFSLLPQQAEFTLCDAEDISLMDVAVLIGNHELVKRMLDHCYDVNCKKRPSQARLQMLYQQVKNTSTVCASRFHRYPFMTAVMNGDLELVKVFLEGGVDVNRRWLGFTPMSSTGLYHDSLDATNAWAETAIEIAGSHCLALLLQYGADPNTTARLSGHTLLEEAVGYRRLEEIDALLKAGAWYLNRKTLKSPPSSAFNGRLPLRIAIERGYKDVVKRLLKADIYIDAQDIDFAISKNRLEIVELLLDYSESY